MSAKKSYSQNDIDDAIKQIEDAGKIAREELMVKYRSDGAKKTLLSALRAAYTMIRWLSGR